MLYSCVYGLVGHFRLEEDEMGEKNKGSHFGEREA